MTHPTREEWMSFLYEEVSPGTKSLLQGHLDTCTECRHQVDAWQHTTRTLDSWALPSRRPRRPSVPLLRLAAAAALLGLAIVGATRAWSLSDDVAELRAELKREVSVRDAAIVRLSESAAKSTADIQSVVTELTKALEEKRLADQSVLLAALQQLQAKHAQDYAGLRKELETVAVLTEAGLRQTRNEIANITYTPETK
jgi:hypothetical protein